MFLGLKDKKVLVTGSSRGIGFAVAKAFLQEDAKVCLTSRNKKNLDTAITSLKRHDKANSLISHICDCSDPKSLSDLKQFIELEWNGLDIVVANVGDGKSVDEAIPPREIWEAVWKQNFTSSLETARFFLPLLQESKGSLLFISSIAGLEAFGAPVDYSTSKSAVLALAKNMARRLGEKIRVNVVAPGNIFFKGGSWDIKRKANPQKVKEIIESQVPMKRFGRAKEVADAILFLSSERASFITGSVLVVDGGQTVGVL